MCMYIYSGLTCYVLALWTLQVQVRINMLCCGSGPTQGVNPRCTTAEHCQCSSPVESNGLVDLIVCNIYGLIVPIIIAPLHD